MGLPHRKAGVGVSAQLLSESLSHRATSVLEGQTPPLKRRMNGGHSPHHRDEKT